MSDEILVERDGGIATVVFNRPKMRNAVSLAMWGEIANVTEGLAKDDAVRAVVLSGAGAFREFVELYETQNAAQNPLDQVGDQPAYEYDDQHHHQAGQEARELALRQHHALAEVVVGQAEQALDEYRLRRVAAAAEANGGLANVFDEVERLLTLLLALTAVPLAAKAGQDSHAIDQAPAGALNQGKFDGGKLVYEQKQLRELHIRVRVPPPSMPRTRCWSIATRSA